MKFVQTFLERCRHPSTFPEKHRYSSGGKLTPRFLKQKKASQRTSDDIAIAIANISKPCSILMMFLVLATVINRFERFNATAAGSFQSEEVVGVLLRYWASVFSRSPQVFKNFTKTLVGGFRSSNNYNSCQQRKSEFLGGKYSPLSRCLNIPMNISFSAIEFLDVELPPPKFC